MYIRNPEFFCDTNDNKTIFIDLENGVFYILPIFANLVFRALVSGKTMDETLQILQDIEQMPSDVATRADKVLNQLLEYRLIVDSDLVDIVPMPEITENLIMDIQDEEFEYEITVSSDIQKMLMDDPIHDVSLDGWSPILNNDKI